MKVAPKAKGVRYITLLMIAVGILFIMPGILYMLEGGPLIALLPLALGAVSMVTALGLYEIKKFAWLTAIIIGLVGTLIFMADWVNVNIESIIGSILTVVLLGSLVLERKYYLTA